MTNEKSKFKREIGTWVHYFVIAFIAATIAYSVFEGAQRGSHMIGVDEQTAHTVEINIVSLILSMWKNFYRWWFGVFIGLSALRFLIIYLSNRIKDSYSMK